MDCNLGRGPARTPAGIEDVSEAGVRTASRKEAGLTSLDTLKPGRRAGEKPTGRGGGGGRTSRPWQGVVAEEAMLLGRVI
jgi:hypothetical protein